MGKKVALVILDGWGIGNHQKSDAVFCANTPVTDALTQAYPHASLLTHGANVGLPDGQMGNSEVGHMNIGAGRIVWQMLEKINRSFSNRGDVSQNRVLNQVFSAAASTGKPLHLMGLMSDGGVHAHIDHIIALCKLAVGAGVNQVFVHAFLDGRDTDPQSGLKYLEKFLTATRDLQNSQGVMAVQLSTVVGRYFAMDRDQRWERVQKAYDVMVKGVGEFATDGVLAAVKKSYESGVTDEFMLPIRCLQGDEGLIKEHDVVLNANFRTDRGRQITRALCLEAFPEQQMKPLTLNYYTLTQYDETFKISGVVFENDNLEMTLGEVVAAAGKTQLRAAETEKYPHVTFFFSGGREEAFDGEIRLMENSPKVATYDLQPEMSAIPLTDRVLEIVQQQQPDFVCLNYANADMVGHTGVYEAIVKAVETVDGCLGRMVKGCTELGYEMIVIADHGNADFAINADGSPNTAHSTNPVPVWWITEEKNADINSGILADVAPSILDIMGIQQPELMGGKSLLIHG